MFSHYISNLLLHFSFLLKSSTLQGQPTKETAAVENHYSEIETGVREELGLTGGLCVVSAAASIAVMFVDTLHKEPTDMPVPPFTLLINDNFLVFDQIDSSPV